MEPKKSVVANLLVPVPFLTREALSRWPWEFRESDPELIDRLCAAVGKPKAAGLDAFQSAMSRLGSGAAVDQLTPDEGKAFRFIDALSEADASRLGLGEAKAWIAPPWGKPSQEVDSAIEALQRCLGWCDKHAEGFGEGDAIKLPKIHAMGAACMNYPKLMTAKDSAGNSALALVAFACAEGPLLEAAHAHGPSHALNAAKHFWHIILEHWSECFASAHPEAAETPLDQFIAHPTAELARKAKRWALALLSELRRIESAQRHAERTTPPETADPLDTAPKGEGMGKAHEAKSAASAANRAWIDRASSQLARAINEGRPPEIIAELAANAAQAVDCDKAGALPSSPMKADMKGSVIRTHSKKKIEAMRSALQNAGMAEKVIEALVARETPFFIAEGEREFQAEQAAAASAKPSESLSPSSHPPPAKPQAVPLSENASVLHDTWPGIFKKCGNRLPIYAELAIDTQLNEHQISAAFKELEAHGLAKKKGKSWIVITEKDKA